MKNILITLGSAIVLSACSTTDMSMIQGTAKVSGEMAANVGSATSGAMKATGAGLTDAALSPLEDLNLRRDEIPRLLSELESPYGLPADLSCFKLTRMVLQLDSLLGADWDIEEEDERLRSERMAGGASSAALKAVADEARGVIPFRGIVRRATGAHSHSRAYARAFTLGEQRRAFLKGFGLASGCDAPAAPVFNPVTDNEIITFREPVARSDRPVIPVDPVANPYTLPNRQGIAITGNIPERR